MGEMYLIFLINQRLFFLPLDLVEQLKSTINSSSKNPLVWLFAVISEWDWHFEQVKIRISRALCSVLHSFGCWMGPDTANPPGMQHSECSLEHILTPEGLPGSSYCSPPCPGRLAVLKVSSPISGRRGKSPVLLWVSIFAAIHTFGKNKQNAFFLLNTAGLFPVHRWPCPCSCSWGCDPKLSYCIPCFGSSQLLYSLCAHLWHS